MAYQKDPFSKNDSGMTPGRRRLLQTLTAAGGTAAVFKFLPRHWTKPIVDMIEIPVHAQGSLDMILLSELNIEEDPTKATYNWRGEFAYEDPASGVSDAASLYAVVQPGGELIFDNEAISAIPNAFRGGTASVGNVSFRFGSTVNTGSMHMWMSMGIRNSNQLLGKFSP